MYVEVTYTDTQGNMYVGKVVDTLEIWTAQNPHERIKVERVTSVALVRDTAVDTP